jgi:hypothetical protein
MEQSGKHEILPIGLSFFFYARAGALSIEPGAGFKSSSEVVACSCREGPSNWKLGTLGVPGNAAARVTLFMREAPSTSSGQDPNGACRTN